MPSLVQSVVVKPYRCRAGRFTDAEEAKQSHFRLHDYVLGFESDLGSSYMYLVNLGAFAVAQIRGNSEHRIGAWQRCNPDLRLRNLWHTLTPQLLRGSQILVLKIMMR